MKQIVVVVFHHEIRPTWPVSVSIWTPSKRHLRGLPGRLLPRAWYSISAFGNIELFMRWTCFTQLCLYFVIFSRTDVVLSSCKMSSFFLWSKRIYPVVVVSVTNVCILSARLLLSVQDHTDCVDMQCFLDITFICIPSEGLSPWRI
jgi:hypothetical protein